MAYRIDYHSPVHKHSISRFRWQMPLMTCLFFLLFVASIKTAWPAGSQALRQLLLPPDSLAESETALEALISNLKDGQPFYESLTAFCQQIIAHAQLTPA